MTGKNTYCTTVKFCSSSRSGSYLYMEAASCHRSSSIFLNNKWRCGHSTLFSLYVDRFSLPTTYGTVLYIQYSSLRSLKLLHDDWSTGFPFMAMILKLCPYKYMVLGCLFVIKLGRFLTVPLGDVILDSDWLSTAFRESWQHYTKTDHSSTMY